MARGVLVSAILFAVLAVVLSILAYVKRIKAEDVTLTSEGGCTYPHSSSYALGIVAALVLLIEQLIISVGIGCFCCGRGRCPANCCGITSLVVFVLSWLSFLIAFIGLITTATLNNRHYLANNHHYPANGYSRIDGSGCMIGKENLFLGTAIWCIFTVVFGLISYATFGAGVRHNRSNQRGGYLGNVEQGNVAMGQTQMPEKY